MKKEEVSQLIQLAIISCTYKTQEELASKLQSINFQLLSIINEDSGYDAIICRSTQTKDIVLFHIGTDYHPMKQIVTGINDVHGLLNTIATDIINDAYIFFQQNLPQIKDALRVFNDVLTKYSDSKITQVGYSLGGFMAQICYASATQKIDTLVLDSPGASEIVRQNYPNFIEEERGNLEYYYRPYNAINTCGTRLLAESHPVHVIAPFSITGEEALFATDISFGTKFFNYLAYSLAVHDIINFNNDFKQIDTFQQVTNWPSGVMQGFQSHLSASNKPHWEKVVEFKIYPDIGAKFNQPKSTNLLKQVTEFFNSKYLKASPEEFNWALYTANIDTISNEYYLSAQQPSTYSLLSKTQEFFCLSCCCYLYIPFKILKAGYNYLTNNTKTADSLQDRNKDEQQALIAQSESKHYHQDSAQCIIEEIQQNRSKFQFLIKLEQNLVPNEINLYYSNNSIYDSKFHPEDIAWDKITKVSYGFLTVGNIAPNPDTVATDWENYVAKGQLPTYSNTYATGIYSPNLYDTDPWSGLYKISGYNTNSTEDASTYGKNTIGKLLELAGNRNKSVILSIGGWSSSITLFHAIMNHPEELLKGIIDFLKQLPSSLNLSSSAAKNVHGIDIDFEPYANDWSKMQPIEIKAFIDTIVKLRQVLTKEFTKNFELRLTMSGNPDTPKFIKEAGDTYHTNFIKQLNDSAIIQVMTYDYLIDFDRPILTSLHSPLYCYLNQSDKIPYNLLFNIEDSMKAYVKAGFKPDNLRVGTPQYGRAYEMNEAVPWNAHSKFTDYLYKLFDSEKGKPLYINQVGQEDSNGSLKKSIKKLLEEGSFKEFEVAGTAFAVSTDGTTTISYDNPNTIKTKAEFVIKNNYGGMFFWTGNGDVTGELVSAAYDVFNTPLIELPGDSDNIN
jgi:chitinase